MGSSIIEAEKAKSESKQQTARAEQLLGEISRAVQPITKLEATYWIEVSPKDEKTLAYIERVREAADEANNLMKKDRFAFPKNGITPAVTQANGELWQGSIDEKSPLWPSGDVEFIGEIAKEFVYGIAIMKKPVQNAFLPVGGRTDFTASSFSAERPELMWNVKESKLYLFTRASYDPNFWNGNGKIAAIVDLRGAQLEFTASAYTIEGPDAEVERKQKERRTFESGLDIRTVALRVSAGRDIWLSRSNYRRLINGDLCSLSLRFLLMIPNSKNLRKVTRTSWALAIRRGADRERAVTWGLVGQYRRPVLSSGSIAVSPGRRIPVSGRP
jgi:hypothetical protein